MAVFINKSLKKFKYLIFFLNEVFNNFIKGYIICKNRISIVVPYFKLFNILLLLNKNIIAHLNSLLDISVIDNPANKFRFELNYVFLNYYNSLRFIIKTNCNSLTILPSINSLYPSSN